MMLEAWNEGVVSCSNGIANPESLAEWLGLKADEQGYGTCSRRLSGARAGPRSAPIRGVSAEAVREAASLLESLGQQVQEIAIEVEEGYADNFIKVWIAQTGDEVHTYERLCGRQLDVDQLEPLSREMYELSSQINAPTTWARSTGCAATRGG
jgi:hypothetical protein